MRWKWRPQYSALYIALNELGQVMTWCLCRDQKHETATPYLKDLAQRAGEVVIFVTDDCCKDRGWFQSIFGPNCKVYQDTFHLVQRLARSVNKRHQFGWSAIGKLQNILQGPATRDELEERLDNWMKTFEETGVITLLVKRAVAAAKRHIRKGCLDYLGTGTQPNEGCDGRERWFEPCRRLYVLRRRRFLGTVAGDGRERWFEPCWRLIVLRRRRARCQRPYSGAAAP